MKPLALLFTALGLGVVSQPLLAEVDLNLFESRLNGNEAAVRPLRDFPASAVNQACRRVLTGPARAEVRQRLSAAVEQALPENVSFIQADIEGYQSWSEGAWLHCRGSVQVSDWPANLAGLAVRAAWHYGALKQPEPLRPLLKVALEHPSTTADAVALIASLAPQEQQKAYLESNLAADQLTMPEAMEAVAGIWLGQARWESVMALTERCDSVACRRLGQQAREQKEKEDAEKADDLSSYF